MGVPVEQGVDDIVDHVDVLVPVKLVLYIVEITTQRIQAASQQITDIQAGFR